mgnify:CR=1 FL=1
MTGVQTCALPIFSFANSLWGGYEIISHESHGETVKARIRIPENGTTNDLLASMIPNVQIHGFREVLPGMSDIFISLVNESNKQEGVPA